MRKNFSGKGFAGAVAAAVLTAAFMLLLAGSVLFDCFGGPPGPFAAGIALFCVFLFLAIAAGVLIALVQRWREIQGGEEDEAKKY